MLDSVIISEFPEIFAEFHWKQFWLLWRGSSDGFRALDFHERCDGHANTLTVIQDTNGNIFGGFTPVEWESPPRRKVKGDESFKSFIFTLKNSQNIPARKFALKADGWHRVMLCDTGCGPHFWDIGVSDDCNKNMDSYTEIFGSTYINDTGVSGGQFFTNSRKFTVKEIEVFEITD
jgi:hypothetical protein